MAVGCAEQSEAHLSRLMPSDLVPMKSTLAK